MNWLLIVKTSLVALGAVVFAGIIYRAIYISPDEVFDSGVFIQAQLLAGFYVYRKSSAWRIAQALSAILFLPVLLLLFILFGFLTLGRWHTW